MDASVGDEQHPESDAAAPPESFEAGAPLTTAAATTSKPLSPRLTHPKQWEMFQRIDTDGSGQLDEDEMFAFFADYADDGIANALIEALDRDGDSLIDFEEFCAGWQRYFGGVEGEVATVAEVQAAVRLQASIRGRQARKSLGTKPDAAATIQGATRRYLATSRAKRFVHALTAQQQARKRQNEEFEAKRAMRYGKGRPGAAKGKGSESVRQPQLQPQLDCPGEHGLVRFEATRSFGCDLCGAHVQSGSHLHGCRTCDYDVCHGCFEAEQEGGEPQDSVLNRTLSRSTRPAVAVVGSSSASGGLSSPFFEAARGLNADGDTDSDCDSDDNDEASSSGAAWVAVTKEKEKVVEAELRYDARKGRYVQVESTAASTTS